MPDAPPPQYNDRGRPYADWLLVVRYDALRDHLTLSWSADATPWEKRKAGAQAWSADEYSAMKDTVAYRLDLLMVQRLF